MIARRDGMTVAALRFPLLGWPADGGGQLAEQAELYRTDPGAGVSHLWTYLDSRDAARACWLAATVAAVRLPPDLRHRAGHARAVPDRGAAGQVPRPACRAARRCPAGPSRST